MCSAHVHPAASGKTRGECARKASNKKSKSTDVFKILGAGGPSKSRIKKPRVIARPTQELQELELGSCWPSILCPSVLVVAL